MKKKTIVLIAFLCFTGGSLLAQSADEVAGEWLTADKKARVEIYACGDEAYCGKISWLKEPNNPDGSPKLDKENPDAELRDRPILGVPLLKDLEYDGDGEYEDGEIYDPESGKTYSCQMELSEDGQNLKVRGFLGISLLGRTEEWTRAE